MGEIRFEPWIGSEYCRTRLLIVSESAYSWKENGKVVGPGPTHPRFQILRSMECFPEQKYYAAITRALCGKQSPTYDEQLNAWNQCAYTIFVQGTVGLGARTRPSDKQFRQAWPIFLETIQKMDPRPLKVVITGMTMWNNMVGIDGPHLSDHLQALRLSSGDLVWCLAIPHPASGLGFQWKWVGERIQAFRSIDFPIRG